MTGERKAPGGGPGAADLRRGGEALASTHIVPQPAKNCKPPGHLTPDEAKLWAAAEAIRDIDPIEYRERRRALGWLQRSLWVWPSVNAKLDFVQSFCHNAT